MKKYAIPRCSMTVHDSRTGELIGAFEPNDRNAFRAEYAEACSSPEGHVAASKIFDARSLRVMGLTPDRSVYVLEH